MGKHKTFVFSQKDPKENCITSRGNADLGAE